MKAQPTTEQPSSIVGPEARHYYCECNSDIAICGEDVSASHECPDDDSCGCVPCVVCDDLIWTPCPRCGS